MRHLQHSPECIRNICVLAHVDHGKTTLSDFLIASNGIISNKLAGKIRYLDSREDEQERCITMKASSIALTYQHLGPDKSGSYLINLIDSPGHVDFSTEVTSAVRVCDGGLVVVDVVEGVCTQTHTVLMQAFEDHIKPCLVLNKIDRLFLELQMDALQIYRHLLRILEEVNSLQSMIHKSHLIAKSPAFAGHQGVGTTEGSSTAGADMDDVDSEHLFSPCGGNVVFSSALEGWAFRISDFAALFADKLGVKVELLQESLWGEFYFQPKTGAISRTPFKEGQDPMFAQFVVRTLHSVYQAILASEQDPDRTMLAKVISTLKLSIPARELTSKSLSMLREAVLGRWLPLSSSVLAMVVEQLPSPAEAQRLSILDLVPNLFQENILDPRLEAARRGLMECSSGPDAPVVAFLSKMLETETLPGAVLPSAVRRPGETSSNVVLEPFVGFARLFCGTLHVGQALFLITTNSPQDAVPFVATQLYCLMGRSMEPVDIVSAGHVFGIAGLGDNIIKNGTLSSERNFPPMKSIRSAAASIVRVAVEPENAQQLSSLMAGLRLLDRSDPSVEVYVSETGEYVIGASGEVHLERCLKDLREKFAKCPLHVSSPIVSFQESLGPKSKPFTVSLPNGLCLRAFVLPEAVVEFLEANAQDFKAGSASAFAELRRLLHAPGGRWAKWAEKVWSLGPKRVGPNLLIDDRQPPGHRRDGPAVASAPGTSDPSVPGDLVSSIVNGFQIACKAGPLCEEPLSGIAFVVSRAADVSRQKPCAVANPRPGKGYDSSSDDEADDERDAAVGGPAASDPSGSVTAESETIDAGEMLARMKDACREAVVKATDRRLKEPVYHCQLVCNESVMGKASAVLSKRRAKILLEDVQEGTSLFVIQSLLPVVESFGFAEELRKKTSGAAAPQLRFEKWVLMDDDPLEEIVDEDGDRLGSANVARKVMDDVRRRKGLFVKEKIVASAEKQRTLTKNK